MGRIVGLKQVQKAVQAGRATMVYIALDAQLPLRQTLSSLAAESNVPVTYVESMAQLGKECGIKVGSATAADVCD